MKNFKIHLLFSITLISVNISYSQNKFESLNLLPTTLEVNAPQFNTEKKYIVTIDSLHGSLLIQDLRRSKKNQIHEYQWLYEIPIDEINTNSFNLSKDNFENDQINFTVKTNSKPILTFWFENKKISSIMTSHGVILGNWYYSSELKNKLENLLAPIKENLSKVTEESDSHGNKFKFINSNVIRRNANLSEDLSISDNGHHFAQIINDQDAIKYPKLLKKIKSFLKTENINTTYPIPVFIYANKSGHVESIILLAPSTDIYCKMIPNSSYSIKLDKTETPMKYVFLLK